MSMKRILALVFVIGVALMGCATRGAVVEEPQDEAPVAEITSVNIAGDEVHLLVTAGAPINYTIYKPSDPFTTVVDLPGVKAGDIGTLTGGGLVSEVSVREQQDPYLMTTIQVLLSRPGDLTPVMEDSVLILKAVAEGAPAASEEGALAPVVEEVPAPVVEAAAAAPSPAAVEKKLPAATEITSLKFAAAETILKFVIEGNGAMKPLIFSWKNRVVVDIPGVKMKAKLPAEVIYPVRTVRHGVYEDKVRLVLETDGKPEFVAREEGSSIILAIPLPIGVKPAPKPAPETKPEAAAAAAPASSEAVAGTPVTPPPAPKPAPKKEVPSEARKKEPARLAEAAADEEDEGICDKRVSLDFQDAEVVPIFRFLGEVCDFNVVLHPTVKGKVNLKLMDVPASQGLDIILELTGLEKSYKPAGRILTIATREVFTQQKEEVARLKQAEQKVEDLVGYQLGLVFISATDFLGILDKQKVMTPRGSAYNDAVSNTLYFRDAKSAITEIKKLAREFDNIKHGTMQYGTNPQIMIEAKMVEVSKDYSRSLGISWTADATEDNFSFINDDSSIGVAVNESDVGGGFLNIGYSETFQLNMSLSALEDIGETRSLANPRVITLDNKPAAITQGVQIPYTVIEDGTATTEFQTAALSLNVTPIILPDGYIGLTVSASNDTPTAVGDQIGVNTQSVNTQARVKNGGTLVLGGIYTNTESVTESRIPVLGKIPFLGWLFKNESKSSSPKELLIFITPTVLTE